MGQAIFRSNTRAQTSLPSQEPFSQGVPSKIYPFSSGPLSQYGSASLGNRTVSQSECHHFPSLDLLGRLAQFLHHRTEEPRKIMVSHLEGFTVRSCPKDDLFVLREGSVYLHGSTVEVAKLRHGAKATIWQEPLELLFSPQSDRLV